MKILGFFTAIIAVVFSYYIAGGNLRLLWQPVELVIVLGAGFGSFLLSNNLAIIKKFFSNLPLYFQSSHFGPALYEDTIGCVRHLNKLKLRGGFKAIEGHIEDPEHSDVFRQYPVLFKDKENMNFLANIFIYSMLAPINPDSKDEVELLEKKQIDNYYKEGITLSNAIHNLGESMPGFGIIAAVLGVTLALSNIDEGNAAVAEALNAALMGTMSGLFFGYAIFGPFAASMRDYASSQKEFQLFIYEMTHLSNAIKNDYVLNLASMKSMPINIKNKLRKTLLEEVSV